MKDLIFGLVLLAAVSAVKLSNGIAYAQDHPGGGSFEQRLIDHVAGADRIVRGTVTDVESYYASNEQGDHLIFTQVTISVTETLKGRSARTVTVKTIGGTVGSISMVDSQYHEPVTAGDLVVAMTKRGEVIPQGWLKINAAQETTEGVPTVAQIRSAINGEF